MRFPLALAIAAASAALVATPALAAERSYSVGSYERVRVEGPFEVHIVAGTSPRASASGSEAMLARLDLVVNGDTLAVRLGPGGWGETPRRAGSIAPVVVTLSSPRITSILLTAGAAVTARKIAGQRVDLSVTGAGALTVDGAEADQLNAMLIGTGKLHLAGKAARARLTTNGPGTIDAGDLVVNDLTVSVEGTGETRAMARYTAQVSTTGLGKVTVLGTPRCTVKAVADGPVICGTSVKPR